MIYKQTRKVSWLKTPEGTLWQTAFDEQYIQPVDKSLTTTPFGVDLNLLDCTEDEDLFQPIEFELGFCPICLQMTNHLEKVCQKCKDSGDRCVF
jgi:hypothetical protein